MKKNGFKALLKGYSISHEQLSKAIGCSESLVEKLVADPSHVRVEYIRIMRKAFGIPKEELISTFSEYL